MYHSLRMPLIFTPETTFPGILGVSFQTPTIQIGKAELHFCQDFVLTVFNKTDGAALPIGEAAAANLSLQTGIRVTIPHL